MFQLDESYESLRDRVETWAREYSGSDRAAEQNYRERTRALYEQDFTECMFPGENDAGSGDEQRDVLALSIVREALARHNCALDVNFIIQGLGGYPVLFFGNEDLKREVLPGIARGEVIPALCLTEPDAGSDLGGLKTRAERDGDDYVLNGNKKFISAGTEADLFVVLAKSDPQKHRKGLSAFLVDADGEGITVEPQEVVAPHDLAQIEFSDCRVPAERRLGEEGDGFGVAMKNLEIFRTTVGGMAVGVARAALEETKKRVRDREMFGQTLGDFQVTQFKLADMATNVRAARLMVYSAAASQNRGEEVRTSSSMAKLFATERAFEVADEAVQLFGGDGVSKDVRVSKLFLESRMARIYEGASEIQRLVIARELLG